MYSKHEQVDYVSSISRWK